MVDIVESGGVETSVNLKASFDQALDAKEPLQLQKGMDVALSPSQLMNGAKIPATVENWKARGFS
ncbi:hypothetical protein [Micavibrio aeruginosavorus]|uniref:Uncharacterized protein n=1 Tax=Micavibrio aeruginosavorus EPB TaxID=349215 RepID=M4VEL3_9BACT|nr:hypothetical protein [Micavibrio aeruginosavorus]AGH97827.1 hypothetical protein A11S_1008 [Micavibrio aeruginosavorus EPB]